MEPERVWTHTKRAIMRCLISIFTVSWAFNSPSVATYKSVDDDQWREVSRAAVFDLANGKFASSAAEFERALKLAGPNADADIVVDLKLGLVEALRLGSNYERAKTILDALEPAVLNNSSVDDMLEARYWRRKSLLQEAMGDRKGSLESYGNALVVICRHFACSCKYSRETSSTFVKKAKALPDQEAISVWAPIMSKLQPSQTPDNLILQYNRLLQRELDEGLFKAKAQQFDESAEIIEKLTYTKHDLVSDYRAWWSWSNWCIQAGKLDKLQRALDSINSTLPYATRRQELLAELYGRLCLALISLHRSNRMEYMHQWSMMAAVLKTARQNPALDKASLLELVLISLHCLRQQADQATQDHNEPIRLSTLQLAVFWSEIFPPSQTSTQFMNEHYKSRLELAQQLLQQHRAEEAVECLNTISTASPSLNMKFADAIEETFRHAVDTLQAQHRTQSARAAKASAQRWSSTVRRAKEGKP